MSKKYKIGLVIEGDGKGGVKAIKATDDALKKLDKQTKKTTKESKSLKDGFGSVAKKAGIAGAALAGTTALVGTFATALRTQAIRELSVLSDTFDVSVESLSSWSYAAESIGLSSEKMGDIFKDTSDKLGDFAATGGGEARDIFENLGLSIEEVKNLQPDEQLLAIAEGLEQVGTNGEKIFYLESLADEASRLLPLLSNGGEGLRKMQREAELLGITLDDVDAAQVQVASDSFRVLGKAAEGFSNQLTIQLSAAFEGLGEDFLSFLDTYGGMEGVTERVVNTTIDGIAFILNHLNNLNIFLTTVELGWLSLAEIAVGAMANSAEGVSDLINLALDPLTDVLATVAEGWGVIFTAVGEFLGETGEGLRDVGKGLDEFAEQTKDFKVDAEDIRKAEEAIKNEASATAQELEVLRNSAPGDEFREEFKASQKSVEEQAEKTVELGEANEATSQKLKETTEATKELAEESDAYAKSWEKAIERVDEAFANGWLDLIQGNASSVFDSILGGFEQMLAEMAHLAITRPILLNVQQGVSSFLGGGLGGGGGGSFGSLSDLSSLGNLISGGVGGSIMGLGTGIASLGSTLGISSLGAFGTGIGSTGAILGTQGLFGGMGTAFANIGGLFSSGSILGGIGAALPLVGLAAGVASLVDSVTGGRLFGTSWETSDYGLDLSYDGGEFYGRQYQDERRRRSLFRGTKRRTNYTELEDGLNEQMNLYFDSIESLIRTGADQLDISEVDNSYNVLDGESPADLGYFNGGVPPWVNHIIESTQSVDEYLEDFVARTELSLKDLSEEDAQAAIKEWTDQVATQMIDGVFGDALDGMALTGETLADTLTRVLVQMDLVNAGFNSINVSLEQLAASAGVSELAFSDDVVNAAGGVERLTALMQGYQAAFFSEQELLERTLSNMADQVKTALDGVGLAYGDDFRAEFEAASANGLAAEELIQWLEAGNLVGQFEEIASQLADITGEELSAITGGFIDAASLVDTGETTEGNAIADPIVEEVGVLNDTVNEQIGSSNERLVSIDNRLVQVDETISTAFNGLREELNASLSRVDVAIDQVAQATAQTAKQVSTVSKDLALTTIDLARFMAQPQSTNPDASRRVNIL